MKIELAIVEELTRTAIDSADGYRHFADVASTPELKTLLTDQANKRLATVARLNAHIERLGGAPINRGTVRGILREQWTNIAALFKAGDETATDQANVSETYLDHAFRDALSFEELSEPTRDRLRLAFEEIQNGQKLAYELKRQYDR